MCTGEGSFQLGVVGGMGPRATVAFLDAFLQHYVGCKDSEVPRMLVDFQTQLPSRSRHVLFGEPSPAEEIVQACTQLVNLGMDAIAIPCNSACALLPRSFFEDGVILNIIDATVEAVVSDSSPRICRALVLGGPVVAKTSVYVERFAKSEWDAVCPSGGDQGALEVIIESIKRQGQTSENTKVLTHLIDKLVGKNECSVVVLACTELEMIPLTGLENPHRIVSSTTALAERCYQLSKEFGEARA